MDDFPAKAEAWTVAQDDLGGYLTNAFAMSVATLGSGSAGEHVTLKPLHGYATLALRLFLACHSAPIAVGVDI